MAPFFVCILKSTVYLLSFYLFYKLLLSRETFFRFNRFALLGSTVLSFILPFFQLSGVSQVQPVNAVAVSMDIMLIEGNPVETSSITILIYILITIYFAGVLFFLCRTCWSFIHLYRLFGRKGEWIEREGMKIRIQEQVIAPFSWMNRIVIGIKEWKENPEAILTHEKGHIAAGHSWDLIWMQLCSTLHWFNPAVWLIKQELQNIHEYEADEYVLSQGIEAKRYQLLLIEKAVGSQRFTSMANSFNHSKLKSRITMMLKGKSNPWARLKYLYILPMSAIVITAFARPEISGELEKISAVKISEIFPGGEITQQNINIQAIGESEKSEPLILVNGVEITSEEMNAISPEKIESVTVLKDESSVKMYGKKGKNGVVLITMHKVKEEVNLNAPSFTISNPLKDNTRYFVDGKEVTKEVFDVIDPSRIESMSVTNEETFSSPKGSVRTIKIKLIK